MNILTYIPMPMPIVVHGNGSPFEGMTKEETRALFLHEVKNPIWCKDVDEFIKLIKEFEDGKVK